MSIQSIDGSTWESSALLLAVRRLTLLVVLMAVLAGPVAIGGALGWILTSEEGPVLGDDGWLRTRPTADLGTAGLPLASSAEIEATGLSMDEARKILRR